MLDELDLTGPELAFIAGGAVELSHRRQFLPHGGQPLDLDVDPGDAALDERSCVAAGAGAAVLDLEELSDLGELQTHRLGSLDEAQPMSGGLVVLAVAGGGAGCGRKETLPLVEANRVGGDACSSSYTRDVERHKSKVNLGVHSKVKHSFLDREAARSLVSKRRKPGRGDLGSVGYLDPVHPNAELLTTFYSSFAAGDHETMARCYADDATFSDPVFPDLDAEGVRAMWRMFCTGGSDIDVSFGDVTADDSAGSASWEARYAFPKTGRPVHNKIAASFGFRDGLIAHHRDDFDFYRWARMALGPVGTALGWSPVVKNQVRRQAAAQLRRFRQNEATK